MVSRSRKWILTLWNDNEDKDTGKIEHINLIDFVKDLLNKYTLSYIIHDKEDNEKEHIHIYINNKTAIRFETLKKYNKYMHIEEVKGNDKQIYEYFCHKDEKSKHENKKIYDENEIKGNYEFQLLNDILIGEQIIQDMESGLTLWEVIKNNPRYVFKINEISKLYEIYQHELSMQKTIELDERRKEIENIFDSMPNNSFVKIHKKEEKEK